MKKNSLLFLLIVFLVAIPLIFKNNASFSGTDTQAIEVIEELAPSYKPWIDNLWKPSSSEVESLLFAVQASIGSIVIGYFIGSSRAKSKYLSRNDRS
ncbi:energy-coupling factor ABC transporter substrate-binding protein [Robertmurraya korlensis]|jgi:cobalt/nickel transport protein|uniref:energy-coupling factor ABC transporter substrate-binding protein n=1 Tax=Robertmurraya korlensis TaxID=519977 RepID=UPI000825FDDA|nr:energy-coupling factor ABC transporter substrate-binding protein [Robertmurraya korlensis]